LPPPTAPRTRRRPGPVSSAEAAARHRHIVDAARRLFVAHGLAGTSFDALAREAQVTKRTIYQLYQNKEGLFVAALSDCVDAIATAVRQTPDQRDLATTLAAIATAYGRALENPETLAMYRLAIGENARIPVEARHAINLYGADSALGVITTLLQRAEERGLVRFRSLSLFAHFYLDLILAPQFCRWLIGEAPPHSDAAVVRFLKATDDLYLLPHGAD
jgi:AcrR family transcriptional regulator